MVLAALLGCGAEAWAQPAGARRTPQAGRAQTGVGENGALRPAEFAELVDAYAVVQAQKLLGLDEEQYGQFVTRFRSLQEVRRKYAGERLRAIQELNRLTRRDSGNEALEAQLKAIDALDATAAAEVRKAVAAVEEGLSIPQRARFRVFEDLMERRKFDLLARARSRARSR
ncbi:MAG: hypothetical protein KJ061_02805 [Vicinamibacteraceae bacterium]|nr:hypothetical protein [Vicinamibacteraceae bacterium]